jgi:hypothetical protein
MRKYVFSSTLTVAHWNKTTIISGDPVAAVRELKEQGDHPRPPATPQEPRQTLNPAPAARTPMGRQRSRRRPPDRASNYGTTTGRRCSRATVRAARMASTARAIRARAAKLAGW